MMPAKLIKAELKKELFGEASTSHSSNRRNSSAAELMNLQREVLEQQKQSQQRMEQVFGKIENFCDQGIEAFQMIKDYFKK
jgi:hypothetical protein